MKTSDRMGVNGKNYGIGERALATLSVLTRDEMLALAWACVDQASSLRTTRLAQTAMTAIEDLYDAEDGAPSTLPDGTCPACETTMCACASCGMPCTRECTAECSSRKVQP